MLSVCSLVLLQKSRPVQNESDSDQGFLADGEGFLKLLEHRSRFTILILLARHDELNFRRFKDLLHETDGNLGAHLRKLEEHSFLAVRKAFEKRKPVSWYALTPKGRDSLTQHVSALRALTANLDLPSA